jgi:hypothetical protein
MPYDEGLAQILRDDLAETEGLAEKRMFGGLCFLLNGNMLCGVHKGGAMFRVGKENEAMALAIEGVGPMTFTGRKMGGLVDMAEEAFVNDALRNSCMALALDFVRDLPPK